jgi:type I restriction enzyme S subunit
MSVNNGHSNLVPLGDYIELCDERNSDEEYTLDDIQGISTEKKFIPTKANLDGVSLTAYKVVKSDEFAYVSDTSRRGDKIALGLNTTNKPVLISSIYTTFRSIDTKKLLPEYLYLFLSREEFDRLSRFNSWGSARETFDWSEFCRIQIPLPDIDVQSELVDTYNGLKTLAEQNEALIKPLTEACQAYIVDCKKKYPEVQLGEYIEECKLKNNENIYGVNELQGVTSNSIFDKSKADTNGLLFDNYKIVHINEFAYNPSRINIGSIALQTKFTCIISPMYIVFKLLSELILPDYLQILFSRKEFQRSTLFYAMGSVRDTFDFNLMKEVKVPLPPPDVQRAIVDIYNCAEEAKRITIDAREKMKNLCPALVQRAING